MPGGSKAFTLLEVLMVMLIMAIAAAFAIPAFSTWLPDYRLKAAARDLFSNLQLAKITAAKNGSFCTICFNQAVASRTFDFVVFVDLDGNLEYDPGEEIVSRRCWADEDQHLGVSFDPSEGGGDGLTFLQNDEGRPAIAFRPSGVPVSNSGGLGMGTAYLRNTKGRKIKVVVSSAGNIRIQ
jgi:prepilin-type N-terminal cleavage/methylation domain-containing protein